MPHDVILRNTLQVFNLYTNAKISVQSPYLNIEMTNYTLERNTQTQI